ncbi:MAG TPA: MerR family transcriptional regulator [Gaiellaceae bacterium]|jgi:DNA-binding transcriptional MerR regulator|nr:MerR family transcriptional regulator [Gaiellaceae bacterium]
MAERTVPLFSIGAVSRMLDLASATIRTWETRYGFVVPQRSQGGQRLYSRDQVDQLRFVKDEVDAGRRPGEAHRLLAERVDRGDSFGGTRLRVLVAESKGGASSVLRDLLGTNTFEVLIASDVASAEEAFDELAPTIVIVDVEDGDFEQLAERIRSAGAKVLPIALLERPLALLDPARPALR